MATAAADTGFPWMSFTNPESVHCPCAAACSRQSHSSPTSAVHLFLSILTRFFFVQKACREEQKTRTEPFIGFPGELPGREPHRRVAYTGHAEKETSCMVSAAFISRKLHTQRLWQVFWLAPSSMPSRDPEETVAECGYRRRIRSLQQRCLPRTFTWFPFHP